MKTVKDLIEELKQYPEDMRVVTRCVSNYHQGVWRDFDGFETGLLNLKENYGLYTGWKDEEEIKQSFDMNDECEFEKVVIFESRK